MGKFDQDLARLRDTMPRMLWAFFTGCQESGFDGPQSMALTQSFLSTCVVTMMQKMTDEDKKEEGE